MKSNDELARAYMSRTSDYRAVFRQMWLQVNKFGDEVTKDDERDYVEFSKKRGLEKWNQVVLKNEICDMAMAHNLNWRKIANSSLERGVTDQHLDELFDAIHDIAFESAKADGLSTNYAQYLSESEQSDILDLERERREDSIYEDDDIYNF